MWRFLTILLVSLPVWADQPGVWILDSRTERISEPPPNAKPYCKWFGESQDLGAKYEASCYSPVSKLTTVTAGHVGWTMDRPLGQLHPGDKLRVSGVVTNKGTPQRGSNATCSMGWNSLGFTKGGIASPGGAERCAGELTIPRPGMRPSGELIKEAWLVQTLSFGSGIGIERYLKYRWQPVQGQVGSPDPGPVAGFGGHWVYDVPNASVEATQNGPNVRLLITQRRWGVPGPHYEISGNVNGRTLTGQWHNIIRDFSAVHPALTRQFGDARCTRGGAMTLELSQDGTSLRVTSVVDSCSHGWLGLTFTRP